MFPGPTAPAPERLGPELFTAVTYTAVLDRMTRRASGVTWQRRLEGVALSTVVVAVNAGAVSGHVTSPLGEFALRGSAAGGYVVQQVAPNLGLGPDDVVIPPGLPGVQAAVASSAPPIARAASHAVVDLLVAYTTTAAALAGGTAQMQADIQVMVGLADTALRASGTGGLRLITSVENGFVAPSEFLTSLMQLQQPADGVMDEILPYRDQVGADVVALITGHPNPDGCGLGYVSASFDTFAYSVVAQQCAVSIPLVLAHEVGHNLGLYHDWYVSAAGGSARGHVSTSGLFRTVMAYPDLCNALGLACSWIGQFSNPVGAHVGFPTGVAVGTNTTCTVGNSANPACDADATTTLDTTAPLVSAYRFTDRLDGGQFLVPGQAIRAPGTACMLLFQDDGNLVAYNGGVPYFATGTGAQSGSVAVLQEDGNLVLYDANAAVLFTSETGGNPGAYLLIQSDCNVVLYAADGTTSLWETGTP